MANLADFLKVFGAKKGVGVRPPSGSASGSAGLFTGDLVSYAQLKSLFARLPPDQPQGFRQECFRGGGGDPQEKQKQIF